MNGPTIFPAFLVRPPTRKVPDLMSVLITGAYGRTSRYVIDALLSSPGCPPLRLLVHSQSSKEMLRSRFPQLLSSPHSIFVSDYLHSDSLRPAFQGVSTVFHNGPSFHRLEAVMGIAVIDAARDSGASPHFIFCSVLHPFRTKLLNHKAKLDIEGYLVESKLDYTILQPTHYMQNVSIAPVLDTGILPLPYSLSTTHGFLDLADLARVSRTVILEPMCHRFASYELVGQNLTYSSVLDTMSAEVGRPVKYEVVSAQEFSAKMVSGGVLHGEYSEDAVERMILYYQRWGLTGSPNTIRWLLGRSPTTWEQYLRRELTK